MERTITKTCPVCGHTIGVIYDDRQKQDIIDAPSFLNEYFDNHVKRCEERKSCKVS